MPRTPRSHLAAPGFFANTDFGWFSHFLHRAEPPDEVDFWQPRTSPRTSAGGREYERFAGRAITVPRTLTDQPDPELLDWHAAECSGGSLQIVVPRTSTLRCLHDCRAVE